MSNAADPPEVPPAGADRGESPTSHAEERLRPVESHGHLLCSEPRSSSPGHDMDWLVRTIESEIIPRLIAAHQGEPSDQRRRDDIDSEQVRAFTEIVLKNESDVCQNYVQGLREQGVPLTSIYLDLLTPSARRLDAMWVADECDFTQITIALWRMQQIVYNFSPEFRRDSAQWNPDHKRIMLMPVPGSQHTLGILMVSEFFHRAGWHVWGEPTAGYQALIDAARDNWFDMAGISVGSVTQVETLTRFIVDLRKASRNDHLRIIIGGPLLHHSSGNGLLVNVGADGIANDATEAVALANRLISDLQNPPRRPSPA